MRALPLIAFLTLISAAAPAAAEDYAPGTLGYLHANCREAVQSETVDNLVGSYCARFFSGYVQGYMRANWIVPGGDAKDPCHAEMTRQYEHIENRTCQTVRNRPAFTKTEPILSVMHMFFGWVDFLKENGQDDKLQKPAAAVFNDMIRPGPYCAVMENFSGDLTRYELSPALHKIRNNPIVLKKAYDALIARPAQEQCARDSANPDAFRASLCGAEVSGYIAGMNSTKWIQENKLPAQNESCQPGVTRLYNTLDAPARTCIRPETDPVLLILAHLAKPVRMDKPAPIGQSLGFINLCPQKR